MSIGVANEKKRKLKVRTTRRDSRENLRYNRRAGVGM